MLPETVTTAAAAVESPILAETLPVNAQALLKDFQRTGSEAAFEQIVRAYAGMVYTVCLGVTKNAHDAEDSAQATFLSLATQIKLGKSVNFVGPWLRQVAKRTALDHRKSRQRRERRENKHGREAADRVQPHEGEALLDGETYREALHEELNKLPERYRAPLKLHYLGGLSSEEAAIELNCKPQTLAVRLHRGRKMLASNLSRRGMFLSAEMLGLSCMPVIPTALKVGSVQAASHVAAATNAMVAHNVAATIVAQVMSVFRASSNVLLFSKMKFAVIVMLLAAGPLLANGARIARVVSNMTLQLPTINFDVMQWLRPLLKTASFSTAIATNAKSDSSQRQQQNDSMANMPGGNAFVAMNDAGDGSPRLTLISADDRESFSSSRSSLSLFSAGDTRLAMTSANLYYVESRPRGGVPRINEGFATTDSPTSRPTLNLAGESAGSSVTPEPTAATLMSLSVFALRRRRNASH